MMMNISSKLQLVINRSDRTHTLPFTHGVDVDIQEGNCLTTATQIGADAECGLDDSLLTEKAGWLPANGCWERVGDVNGFPSYYLEDQTGINQLRLAKLLIQSPHFASVIRSSGFVWQIVDGTRNSILDITSITDWIYYYNLADTFFPPESATNNGTGVHEWLTPSEPDPDPEDDAEPVLPSETLVPPPTLKLNKINESGECIDLPKIISISISNSDDTPVTLNGKVSFTLKSANSEDLIAVKHIDTKGMAISFPTGSIAFECSVVNNERLFCNDILTLEICSLCPEDKQDCCSEDKPSFIVTDQINSICVDAPCTCPLPTVVYFSSEQDTRLTVKHTNGSLLLDTGPVTTTNNVARKLVTLDNQLYYSSTYFARIFPVSIRPVYVNTSSTSTNYIDLPVYEDECGDTDYLKCHPLYFPSPSECINSKQGRCVTKDNTVGDGYWIFYFNDCVEDLRFCINNTTGTNWTLEVEDGVGSTVKSLTQGGVSDTCFIGTTDICAYNMQFGSDINVNYSEEIYTPTEENLIDVSSRRQS